MSELSFLNDPSMNTVISEIIDIFNNVEGVELVRLSGMTRHANKIGGIINISQETVDMIIKKLKSAGIINYKYIINCPHCHEQSFIIQSDEQFIYRPKLCDTCSTFYPLVDGATLYKQ
jgi:transcription initiation factor IIE alpha subunit